MKVIVFGGSGFLGSHVADALAEAGHQVAVFDRKPSPYLGPDRRMIVGDILDPAAVDEAVRGHEVVYNFAAIGDLSEANQRPYDTVRINILGHTAILEAARVHGVRRLAFASSIYVYSDSGDFYRTTKQAGELLLENYQRVYGLPYTVLRYGSIYGDRADEHNWIHRVLKQAVTEGRIVRYGDGEEIREYIHVRDAARCSVEILSPPFENQNVVITGPHPIRVKDLLTMIRELMGNRIQVEYRPPDDAGNPYSPRLHYQITPYAFKPKMGRKLISNYYTDLGEGLLNCLAELHARYAPTDAGAVRQGPAVTGPEECRAGTKPAPTPPRT